jgi:hypothetical protein
MHTYLVALGFDIWKSIMTGYIAPKNPPTYNVRKNASEHNAKSMNVILCGLLELEFVKMMHCESEKYIWYKIKNIYEGNEKVNKVKLQTHII